MVRRTLTVIGVTEAAMILVDRDGLPALNLTAVAQMLTVRPSALYTHIDGLDGLHTLLAVAATNGLVSEVRNAAIGVAGKDALDSASTAYRHYALAHPGLYQSTLLPACSPGDVLTTANTELLNIFALIYRGIGLDSEQSARAARCTRTAIHGFVTLEIAGGSNPDHDQHFQELMETISTGLPRPA